MLRNLIFTVFYFLTFLFCNSVEDEEFWYSAEINKKITEKFKVEFERQIRLNDDYSTKYKSLSETSISYQVFPVIELSAKYRYVVKTSKTEERISFGSKFSLSDNWYIPTYKIKLQQDFNEDNLPKDFVLRFKMNFDFPPLFNLNPSIYFESYHTKESNNYNFDKFRISPSVDFCITSQSSLKLFFIYKGEIKDSITEATKIFGTKYEFSF